MKNINFTLGMGTFRRQDKVAYDSVKMALEEGYRHIDTAQIYGNEAEVGQAIADSGIPRDELFITTKVWFEAFSEDKFVESVKESLSKLKIDYVDLLLIHWPSPQDEVDMTLYLNELKKTKKMGLAREIGISNFTIALTQQALDILGEGELFTNQIEVHPYLQNDKLVDYCQANGIQVTGYMPFAYGKVLANETLKSIAEKNQISTAQLVIQWLAQRDIITIPSSTKRKNLRSNFEQVSVKLSDADMNYIAELDCNDRQANPDFSPKWDL
ncbi:aldo/keto reductase [Marinomonas ushuaiensis DSM 15871]|uniref:Aldo/keto reductase n=1 Tax=Marinomonas ushuaiensis DSM 15871 TaxID=1122207 RepID=X7E4Z8_9GAMM|nr:2,5-didehydrogluconate reductase DkgB [Marinomonas ushuaiensis]ETX11022.1 aldo/keto reductase [Marinomonas ushuaiensis DSM 15871]